jgi:AcrR family transcriptional regulator
MVDAAEIARLRDEAFSMAQIAQSLGVSVGTIFNRASA